MAIEVETPEVIIVRLECEDGSKPIEVRFTRAEFNQIEMLARIGGVPVTRFIIDCALKRAKHPLMAADRGGSA